MYLTVYRVHSPVGTQGVNGALYLHQKNSGDAMYANPNLGTITTTDPGIRLCQLVELEPGGNDVLSLLDVCYPDDLSSSKLSAFLEQFQASIRDVPHTLVHGEMIARFSCALGQLDQAPVLISELVSVARQLTFEIVKSKWLLTPPLIVNAECNEDGCCYQVDEDSKRRIRAAHGDSMPQVVDVPSVVESEFRQMHGLIYPHLIESVSGIELKDAHQLGGVRFIRGGRMVWEWPSRDVLKKLDRLEWPAWTPSIEFLVP